EAAGAAERAVLAVRSDRARWGQAGLAALTTAVASWPVTLLLREGSWVAPALVGLGVIAVTGALARAADRSGPAVVALQAGVTALVLSWILVPGYHWLGLPRLTAVGEAARLVGEGVATIRDEMVPVPARPGMVLVVVVAIALVGLAVDALAATRRSPALAGLPLLVVLTVSASGTGVALHPKYFLAAAAAWLLLVARQGVGEVRAWRRTGARAGGWGRADGGRADGGARGEEDPFSHDRAEVERGVAQGAQGYARWGRALGAAAVVLALLVPAALPHLPPTVLAQGLVRAAGQAQDGQVSFTDTLDLAADLASRSTRPVLRYRTDDPVGTPLRVAVSTTYDGRRWVPAAQDPPVQQGYPLPPGGIDVEHHSLTVFHNELRAPQVAVPANLTEADFGAIRWGMRPATGAVVVAERPESYGASYWRVLGTLPEGTGQGGPPLDADPATLEVDPASAPAVTALAQELAGRSTNQMQVAMAIQSYLRGSAFRYSLTLADPVPGPDGQPLDPITHFLETKVGYCVQFATAMVMMARAAGIPARLAVGFLPGEKGEDGARTVVAADAHAWPELYINGLGWTRYEPTPGARSGTAPIYRTPGAPIQPAPAPSPTAAAERPSMDTGLGDTPVLHQPSPWDTVRRFAAGAAAGVALTLLGALVPLAARWRRRAARRGAGD
ncbi:transglutaminaseTgpA domain-containing protein, partial [Georgenia thermotolerans]